jgi:hypothetical protein
MAESTETPSSKAGPTGKIIRQHIVRNSIEVSLEEESVSSSELYLLK